MTAARRTDTDIKELVNHLKAITDELTALHGDLYWLAMQAQDVSAEQSSAAALNVEMLSGLKGAVDNMRLLLWNYIETASQTNPQRVRDGMETQRVQRMTQFLKLLRERLGSAHDQQPLSFIERISAAMKERLGNKVA
jgi:DNA-binding transcriptional regulator YbjK